MKVGDAVEVIGIDGPDMVVVDLRWPVPGHPLPMTLEEYAVAPPTSVKCAWFTTLRQYQQVWFPYRTLRVLPSD